MQGESRVCWRRDAGVLFLLVLLSFLIRGYRLGQPSERFFDEIYYPDGAASYLTYGVRDPKHPDAYPFDKDENHVHPPAGKLFMGIFMEMWWGMERYVLGNDPESPVAWRIGSLVLGVAVILMTWRLALAMSGRPSVATMAAFLVAIDPLHIVQSRIGMIDMYEAFWIMAGLICTWRHIEAPPKDVKWACWAGAAFGWGLATKWSTLFAMVGALLAVFLLKRPAESASPCSPRVSMTFRTVGLGGAVAVVMYLVSYLPLLRANHYDLDHTLADIKFYYTQMWNFRYDKRAFHHRYMSQWWEWPICYRPMWYVYREEPSSDQRWCHCEVAQGSPVTWLFFLACLPMCVRAVGRRRSLSDRALAFAALTYLPQVVLWSINEGFMYYMLPVVPLMAIVIGLVLDRWKQSPLDLLANTGLLVAAFAWAAVFYPLEVGVAVPKAYFQCLMLLRSWI